MYKIDKTIPIPSNAGRRGPPSKYPFPDMEVGDSLFSENKSLGSAAYAFASSHNIKFCCYAVDGGFRVWRIA